jgi:hypothetical protein
MVVGADQAAPAFLIAIRYFFYYNIHLYEVIKPFMTQALVV